MIEIWVLIMLLKGTKENVYRIWKSEGISSRLGSNVIPLYPWESHFASECVSSSLR